MKKVAFITLITSLFVAGNALAMDLSESNFVKPKQSGLFTKNDLGQSKINPKRSSYVTLGFGVGSLPESKVNSLDTTPDVYTYKSSSSNHPGVSLAIGHTFSNRLGVEFDYTQYKSAGSEYSTTLPIDPTVLYSVKQTSKANEKDLYATYAMPLTTNIQAMAKLGYGDVSVKNHYVTKITGPNGSAAPDQTLSKTINDSGVSAGLGVQYAFASRLTVGANVSELFAKDNHTAANLTFGVLF